MEIGIVAATSRNGVIGREGKLPWRPPPADMARMHSVIDGNVIIIGRHTMADIPQKWPCKYLTVSTTMKDASPSLEHAIRKARQLWPSLSIYLLGGSRIFQEGFRWASSLYLTTIDEDYEGDAYFPRIPSYWALTENRSVDDKLIFDVYENTWAGQLPVQKGLY